MPNGNIISNLKSAFSEIAELRQERPMRKVWENFFIRKGSGETPPLTPPPTSTPSPPRPRFSPPPNTPPAASR